MRVRTPEFDFSQSTGRWLPKAGEFAQLLNANSVVIPYLERFLNRVMAKALSAIPDDSEKNRALRADIRTFIRQEACHYKAHDSFNDMLLRNGYELLPEIEKRIEAHYEKLLATKSLRFLVAYCEGFESLTPPTAASWFDGSMDRMTQGADPAPLAMWKWHIMEEFEHRTVCHDAYHALGGGLLMRAYVWWYHAFSYMRMAGWVYRYLLKVDRANMTESEIAKSKKNAKRSAIGFSLPILRAMPRILSPGYTPRDIPEPKGWAATRDAIESQWEPKTPAEQPV